MNAEVGIARYAGAALLAAGLASSLPASAASWQAEIGIGVELLTQGYAPVLALGGLALVLTLVLLAQVLSLRRRSSRRADNQAATLGRWRPVLLRAAMGDKVLPLVLPVHEREALLLLWNQLQDGLRGHAHQGLNSLGTQIGLHELALRFAARRSGGLRLLGLRTLGHLGDVRDWPRLDALLGDPRSVISLAAARALLRIDARRAAPRVLDEFLGRSDWPAPRLATLLREAGPELIGAALAQRLLGAPPFQQVRLLPLARVTEAPGSGSVIEALLASATEPAVLSATLQQIQGPASLGRVRELCGHADWQVRSYAALALGRQGVAVDRKRLVAMMSDREWWVRYRAAQALLALPGVDAVAIEALRAALTDRYARDMLAQVLAERELACGDGAAVRLPATPALALDIGVCA